MIERVRWVACVLFNCIFLVVPLLVIGSLPRCVEKKHIRIAKISSKINRTEILDPPCTYTDGGAHISQILRAPPILFFFRRISYFGGAHHIHYTYTRSHSKRENEIVSVECFECGTKKTNVLRLKLRDVRQVWLVCASYSFLLTFIWVKFRRMCHSCASKR